MQAVGHGFKPVSCGILINFISSAVFETPLEFKEKFFF